MATTQQFVPSVGVVLPAEEGGLPATTPLGTTAPITGGGLLNTPLTIGISAASPIAAGSMSGADKAKLDSLQRGTGSLVAGVSAGQSAVITATSRIVVTVKDNARVGVGPIGRLCVPSASRMVGNPGSFVVASEAIAAAGVEVNDNSTFDWYVLG